MAAMCGGRRKRFIPVAQTLARPRGIRFAKNE
jgi:hypothetical protein